MLVDHDWLNQRSSRFRSTVRTTEARTEIKIIVRHPAPPPSGLTSTFPNRIWPSGASPHLTSAQARESNVRQLLLEDVWGPRRMGTTPTTPTHEW
jgi:hypothetical protein